MNNSTYNNNNNIKQIVITKIDNDTKVSGDRWRLQLSVVDTVDHTQSNITFGPTA